MICLQSHSRQPAWVGRDHQGRAWSGHESRSLPLAVESSLDILTLRGLVELTAEGYAFRPRTAELEEKTQELAALYRERRAAVTTIIFSRP